MTDSFKLFQANDRNVSANKTNQPCTATQQAILRHCGKQMQQQQNHAIRLKTESDKLSFKRAAPD